MHIKQVAIVGFTSYEYATYTSDNKGSPYVEEFDPKFNVIVGKNGSGKSNFLKAIRFVLHDMRSVAGLRHQRDDGHIAPSGYVQITFDNTDRTIPIDEDEVVLRRTLGMKKGEYYLNKKMTSKEDVMNLLETAGFSRSNPYYIVQQGKIMALTNAKPEDRLELLKEVAGTRVYEERRKESLSILESSDAKADKIKNVLNYIEERLVELEEEKNELKRYQQLDKQKRILEYVLYEKELQEIQSNLDDVEILYSKDNDRSSKENDLLIKIYSDSESAREKYKAITSDKDVLLANRISKKEELEGAIKKRVKLELELSDLINDEAEKEQKKKQVYEELAILKSTINKKREEYKSFLPLYEKVKAEEAVAIQKLESAELRRQELLTKQGRSKQFTKKEDRDIYIKEQLHLFRKKLNEKLSLFEEEQQNYETTELQSKKLAETLKFQIKGLEETKKNIEYSEQQITKKRKLRDEALNEQKKFWAKQKQLERELETVKVDLQRAKRYQETTMNKSHFHALSAVKRIVRNNNIEGYFGPVIENFACDRLFNTAVEVSSGNSLFYVIVDKEETASLILEFLKREKSGRVTFVPLQQLRIRTHTYPEHPNADPLIKYIKPKHPSFKPVMEHIFGKTMLCKDFPTAIHMAKSFKFDCVLIDGDKVSHKGSLTGGFLDARRSRVSAIRAVQSLKEKKRQLKLMLQETTKSVQAATFKASTVTGDYESELTLHKQALARYEREKLEYRDNLGKKKFYLEALQNKKTNLDALMRSTDSLQQEIKLLEKELHSPMVASLSRAEDSELMTLNKRLSALRLQTEKCGIARTETEGSMKALENEINSNLLIREAELEQHLLDLNFSGVVTQGDRQSELHILNTFIENTKRELQLMDDRLTMLDNEIQEVEELIKDLQAKSKEIQEDIEKQTRSRDHLVNKRSIYLRKKEETLIKIRELGSFPTNSTREFASYTLNQLHDKLQKCNENLKKFSHVNKKALDQFINFSEQKETLLERKKKLNQSRKAIESLINHLDKQKDEAIQRTFRQVQEYFSEIFAELAKGKKGSARLIMLTDENEQSQYIGVDIDVQWGETNSQVNQLSGGEKSVMALALIFAIQKADPAPFYIFDEIDQAMDSVYRLAIAERINSLKEHNQFIVTTFHPEMLEYADCYYGIKNTGNKSRIDTCPKHVALSLLQN